jgi:SAM-dependent methyltransferase
MTKINSHFSSPSRTLLSLANQLSHLKQWPVLDVGCGFGRNAIALALQGFSVVCVDRDNIRLRALTDDAPDYIANTQQPHSATGKLYSVCANLEQSGWPFCENCFSVLISVNFLQIELFDFFRSSLRTGGYLYIETFDGHGQNYLDLPKAGVLYDRLSRHFNYLMYRERKVGPVGYDAVSVKLFAKTR